MIREFELPTLPGRLASIRWRAEVAGHKLRALSMASSPPMGRAAASWKLPPAPSESAQETESSEESATLDEVRDKLVERLLHGRKAEWSLDRIELQRGTDFQKRIWTAMHAIPHGTVHTYGRLCTDAGSPKAVRACGAACGANPVVLFIPCHRVVASGGKPGGFSSGLEWKALFLESEGYHLPIEAK